MPCIFTDLTISGLWLAVEQTLASSKASLVEMHQVCSKTFSASWWNRWSKYRKRQGANWTQTWLTLVEVWSGPSRSPYHDEGTRMMSLCCPKTPGIEDLSLWHNQSLPWAAGGNNARSCQMMLLLCEWKGLAGWDSSHHEDELRC